MIEFKIKEWRHLPGVWLCGFLPVQPPAATVIFAKSIFYKPRRLKRICHQRALYMYNSEVETTKIRRKFDKIGIDTFAKEKKMSRTNLVEKSKLDDNVSRSRRGHATCTLTANAVYYGKDSPARKNKTRKLKYMKNHSTNTN